MSVAFDAVGPNSSGAHAMSVSSVSWTHTPSGTPTAVAVGATNNSGKTATSTYGGTSTSGGGTANQGSSIAVLKGLANPASGAQTVAVTFSASVTDGYCGSITVTGSDTTTCFSHVSAGNAGTGGSSSITDAACTSAVGELVVDLCINWSNTHDTFTAGSGQTQRWANQDGSVAGTQSTAPGASSVTMSEAIAFPDVWAIISASFKVASSSAVRSLTLPLLGIN